MIQLRAERCIMPVLAASNIDVYGPGQTWAGLRISLNQNGSQDSPITLSGPANSGSSQNRLRLELTHFSGLAKPAPCPAINENAKQIFRAASEKWPWSVLLHSSVPRSNEATRFDPAMW
jgi:hypothetical protein